MSSYTQMPAAEVRKRALASIESVVIARESQTAGVVREVLDAQKSWWARLWKIPRPTLQDVERALDDEECGYFAGTDGRQGVYISWDDRAHYFLAKTAWSKQYDVAVRLSRLAEAAGCDGKIWVSDENLEQIA